MNDYFARYLLGSLGNEDILENIVNAVLDVKAITNDSRKVIIEIQLSGNIDFLKYTLYI